MKLIDSTGLVFCALFCANPITNAALSPPSVPPQDHLDYIVSVIQHFARHQVGTFECIFEDLELGFPFDGWFGQLIASPGLANIVKYVVNASFKATITNLPPKPSLAVVKVGNRVLQPHVRPRHIRSNFYFLDSNTRVLVLVNVTCMDCVDGITELLNGWQFDRVVYMGVARKVIFLMDHAGIITSILKHFPQPGDLFKSYVRNLRGRGLRYTFKINPWHPAVQWAKETARFANTTAVFIPGICTLSMTVYTCIDQLFNAYDIDLSIDKFGITGTTSAMYRMMFDYEPTSTVIMVPQSRPFSDIEMFVKPFSWESWIVLIGMILLIEVISLIFPTLFKNDPILLLVCGFERYNLHTASTREKLTFFPLIIFFFLMFNAYETKIISFMTNKPSIGNIKTLQELQKSGLKVKTDVHIDFKILNDSLLGPLAIPLDPDEEPLRLDGVNAYMGQSIFAPNIISLLSNYDFKLHRPKYVIIDENRRITIAMYWIGTKTPLAELLHFTQRVFFESGLFDVWKKEIFNVFSNEDRDEFRQSETEHLGLLVFDDLISTWLALAVGLSVSSLVFVLELVVKGPSSTLPS